MPLRSSIQLELIGFLVFCLAVVGCGQTAPKQAEAQKASTVDSKPNAASAKDNWQKMKDCAEQTDRILKRGHLEEGQRIDEHTSVTGAENHYSPKYNQCFVKIFFLDRQADIKKGIPFVRYDIYDAFEGKGLASCTEDGRISNDSPFCSVGDTLGNCAACREFAKDRMNN
jgi:hypothetical protein